MDAHLKAKATEKDIRTRVYQAQVWHRNFPELLNVVVIVKTNLKTGRSAKVLLFSDDLALPGETLKEHTMCDDPRVAGGPDVLSKSAASSQVETKHKATEPA